MDQLYNYTQVASNCSQYTPVNQMNNMSSMSSMTNSVSDASSKSSCLSCQNFKNQHCKLDLYDKITTNLTKYSSEM